MTSISLQYRHLAKHNFLVKSELYNQRQCNWLVEKVPTSLNNNIVFF